MALSALSEPRAEVVSASASPVLFRHHGAEQFRKNAEICIHPKISAHELRRKLRLHLPETIRLAFPAPSQHEMCKQAGRVLGVSPDTVLRLYSGNTDKLDVAVVCAIAARFH